MMSRGTPAALVRDLIAKGIHDKRFLDAFAHIHRMDFIPEEFASEAYRDEPIQIGHGQVTTQPSLIASMVQALRLTGAEKFSKLAPALAFKPLFFQTVPARLLHRKIGRIRDDGRVQSKKSWNPECHSRCGRWDYRALSS
jgi:protein-L-isoaspartate(D-aspartate) O-methyltransferase